MSDEKPLVHTHITIACDFTVNVIDALPQDEDGQRSILHALIKDKKALLNMLLLEIVTKLEQPAEVWQEAILEDPDEQTILKPVLQSLGRSTYPIHYGNAEGTKPEEEIWWLEDLRECIEVSWNNTSVLQSLVKTKDTTNE